MRIIQHTKDDACKCTMHFPKLHAASHLHSQLSQSEKNLRSSLISWSARLQAWLPAGGISGLWSGNVSSSSAMMAADSVTTRPSSSSTGSSPEGTCGPQRRRQARLTKG